MQKDILTVKKTHTTVLLEGEPASLVIKKIIENTPGEKERGYPFDLMLREPRRVIMKKVLWVILIVLTVSCATLGLSGSRVDRIRDTFLRARTFICSAPLEVLVVAQIELEAIGIKGIDLASFCSNAD